MTQEEWNEAKSSILNAFYTSARSSKRASGRSCSVSGSRKERSSSLPPASAISWASCPRAWPNTPTSSPWRKTGFPASSFPSSTRGERPGHGVGGGPRIADNSADLVISNFPFGDINVFDPRHKDYSMWSIHNYFFGRSIDAVRPGGLVVAITSHYTLDSKGSKVRDYLSKKADFVGGLRLPNNAFSKNAGTEVTTDILIFRKRDAVPDKARTRSLR